MVYRFGKRLCPICKHTVGMYSYTWDNQGNKIHLECKEKQEQKELGVIG